MDVKVYKKEEVKQPSGTSFIYVPDVIDIIPELIENSTLNDVRDGVLSLDKLKYYADVEIEKGKLKINSDKVYYKDGKMYIALVTEQLVNAVTVESDKEIIEQACALATIFQRGLDPLDLDDGIQWTEAILEEVNSVELMQQIINSVSQVSSSVKVVFDTVTDKDGNSLLTYKITEVI